MYEGMDIKAYFFYLGRGGGGGEGEGVCHMLLYCCNFFSQN